MKKNISEHRVDEKELDKRIKRGEISPVVIPRFSSTAEIVKYHFCSSIIKYKKDHDLRQKDIADLLEINKSEVSKLFSYNLKEFSGERLFMFVDTMISKKASIDLEELWDQIKRQSEKFHKRLKSKKAS